MASGALTIDELASRSGVASRTIREYQTVGVLAPPVKVGRVGHYDESHVRRLGAIGQLQARGYSLAGIRDLFAAWESGQSLTAVLGVDDALVASSAGDRPAVYSSEQLNAIVPGLVSNVRLRKAGERCGLIRDIDNGWLVGSRSLLQLISDTVAMGVPAYRALEIAKVMADAASTVAAAVTMQFVEEIWTPFMRSGATDVDRARIESYLQRSRAMLQKGAATTLVRAIEQSYMSARPPGPQAFRETLGNVHVGAFDDLRPATSG